MRGYRNLFLGVVYLVVCVVFAYLAGPDNIADLTGVLSGVGVGVVGIVTARAANKWAENGKRQ